jgi:hypothetical protein
MVPMLWSQPPFKAMGFYSGTQAYGSVSVDTRGIAFDPTANPVVNRLVRLIHPSEKPLGPIVHTTTPVSFLRSKRGRFLALADAKGGDQVLVRIQANRVAKLVAALEAAGFQCVEEDITDQDLQRLIGP